MRYRNRYRFRYGRRSRGYGGCVVWMLVIAFFLVFAGTRSDSGLFLPALFVILAFVALIGSFLRLNPNRIYGGLIAFIWFMSLAFCFLINSFWPWLLIPVVLTVLLSVLRGPLLGALLGLGLFSLLNRNQAAPPVYTPPMQPYQPPVQPYIPAQQPQQAPYYQPYAGGYQQSETPSGQAPLQQEDNTNNPAYPSEHKYDQPQSHYPQQELPPQQ